jgi:hypothetical protein
MAFEKGGLIVNFEANADLSAKQYRAVKMVTGSKVDVCSAATDVAVGILQNKPSAAGQTADVMIFGLSKVDSDAALAVGNLISTSSDGQLQVAVATNYPIGHVVFASGAAGELATAIIAPAYVVKA